MGPRASLDGCGKSCPHCDLIPRLSSPQRVATPTVLSQPTTLEYTVIIFVFVQARTNFCVLILCIVFNFILFTSDCAILQLAVIISQWCM